MKIPYGIIHFYTAEGFLPGIPSDRQLILKNWHERRQAGVLPEHNHERHQGDDRWFKPAYMAFSRISRLTSSVWSWVSPSRVSEWASS
jgi:hypothetical protein